MSRSPSDDANAPSRTTPLVGAVDIIIVNWNAGDQLRACLQSIADHGGRAVRSVVVVDNGSVDGSADAKIDGLPLTIIRAGKNLGFGRACNLGAASARAPLLLFLNPDAALLSGGLTHAIAAMQRDEGRTIGALGIKLLDEQGQVQHHTANRLTPRSMFTHAQRATRFDHLHSRMVDHVIGAFYLVRTDVFRSLNGFDERFFVYLEDVDLSARIQDAGWKIHYFAGAQAFHKGGGTSDQVRAARLFYSLRSRILYAFKHFTIFRAFTVAFITFLVEPFARVLRAASRKSGREIEETLAAFALLYRDLPAIARAIIHRPKD